MAVIIDTDVVSFLLKKDTRAELYRPHLEGLPKIISFMTLAELRRWALQNNWGTKRTKQTKEFLDEFSIVYSDEELCKIWAEIKSDAYLSGNPIETADAWIAAVALMFEIPLVTHNRRHFINVKNLKVISES